MGGSIRYKDHKIADIFQHSHSECEKQFQWPLKFQHSRVENDQQNALNFILLQYTVLVILCIFDNAQYKNKKSIFTLT
jgi:hypothetical protein